MVIFIDNGVTGSIGIIGKRTKEFKLTPTVKMQDYTKAKKNVSRIDVPAFKDLLFHAFANRMGEEDVIAVLERPMINPARFSASISAARSMEATVAVLEALEIPYKFCDSKEWQKGVLPSSGKKGTDSATLKQESKDVGLRLFPEFRELISKHGDADGLLGARHFYNEHLVR